MHSGGDLCGSKATPLALRRMNRVEYENTVHDLLGIDTPLAELLPEDGSVQGFDNVADGLGISQPAPARCKACNRPIGIGIV